MYPSRRFDVLGLVQRRQRGGPAGQRDSGAPGLGVYSAWLGGLPGFLSGVPLLMRLVFRAAPQRRSRPRRPLRMAGRAARRPVRRTHTNGI